MRGVSQLAEELAASQGLCFLEVVWYLHETGLVNISATLTSGFKADLTTKTMKRCYLLINKP
jgi:hypothetical protein